MRTFQGEIRGMSETRAAHSGVPALTVFPLDGV